MAISFSLGGKMARDGSGERKKNTVEVRTRDAPTSTCACKSVEQSVEKQTEPDPPLPQTKKQKMAGSLVPVGAYPLFVVMGGAVAGLGFFLNHALRHQDLIWARRYVSRSEMMN